MSNKYKYFLEAVTGRPALDISDKTFRHIIKKLENGENLCREIDRLQAEGVKSINERFRLVKKVREASEEEVEHGGPELPNEPQRIFDEILKLLDKPDTEENAEALGDLLYEHQKARLQHKTIKKRLRVTPLLIPLAEHGRTFIESKRGQDKITGLLEQELEKILRELGPDAPFKKIITEIEGEAETGHSFFQEIDWETETVYIKKPGSKHETTRSFKRINNKIGELRKKIKK